VRRLDRKTGPGEARFGPTSGGISGVIGVICGLGLAVSVLSHGVGSDELPYLFAGLAFATLAWSMLLRPRVLLHETGVELRNGFSQFRIPYAAISEFAVRSFTVVQVGEHRYIGLGVGRSRKSMTRRRKDDLLRESPDLARGKSLVNASEADLLEAMLTERIERAGDSSATPGRQWAVPEVALFGLFLIGLVVSLFV